jgi:hypothetical protein
LPPVDPVAAEPKMTEGILPHGFCSGLWKSSQTMVG